MLKTGMYSDHLKITFRAASKEGCSNLVVPLSGTSRAGNSETNSGQQSGSQQVPDRGESPSSASHQLRNIGKTAHDHPRRSVAKPG